MKPSGFTGERLHEGSALFSVDLARHLAAYRFALRHIGDGVGLDLGCGSGYGAAELADRGARVVGVDLVAPDPTHRRCSAHFLRADLRALPFRGATFDLVLSFQVIEHLADPKPYLCGIGELLRPGGMAILTTPNRLTSDGANPFHVHEYIANELAAVLGRHFDKVELFGVGASGAVAGYFEARLARIRRVLRLDPLRLRERLPRAWVQWLFGQLAVLLRRRLQSGGGIPDATFRDFPVGPADERCLDLLAVCRNPRRGVPCASP